MSPFASNAHPAYFSTKPFQHTLLKKQKLLIQKQEKIELIDDPAERRSNSEKLRAKSLRHHWNQ